MTILINISLNSHHAIVIDGDRKLLYDVSANLALEMDIDNLDKCTGQQLLFAQPKPS